MAGVVTGSIHVMAVLMQAYLSDDKLVKASQRACLMIVNHIRYTEQGQQANMPTFHNLHCLRASRWDVDFIFHIESLTMYCLQIILSYA